MSNKYQNTQLCYLIDHHSPQPPAVPLNHLDPKEYEEFVRESGVDSQMVYCKDHWGVTYYPSKVHGAQMHKGLKEDWIAQAADILRRNDIEFVAYYCIEYDEGAARSFPEWRVRKADGNPLIREDTYARWSLCCTQTGYRQYCLDQLKEIVQNYKPDSLFLDIFGTSLCYCDQCKEKFQREMGYALPEGEELEEKRAELLSWLDQNAADFFDELRGEMNKIDPSLAITVNFSCHYPALLRDKLSYQFSEPLLKDNWFSAAYARDTAPGQYPILAPGEASQVYNYDAVDKYRFDLHAIATQGCRVGMYSGSQHFDGTLEHEEARRLGQVYRELALMRPHLQGRKPIEEVGIFQSDASARLGKGTFQADAILRAKVHNPHVEAVLGAMRLCENAKLPWRVLPSTELTFEVLKKYSLLLLPESFYLSDEETALLKKYVEDGGKLILSQSSSLYNADGTERENFSIAELMGIDFIRKRNDFKRNGWAAYLTLAKEQDFSGLLDCTTPPVSESFMEIRLSGAKVLLEFVLPCLAVTDTEWVNWWSPPPGEKTNLPALTINHYGNGQVVYCGFDYFSMAAKDGYNYLDELFTQMLDCLQIHPAICLKTNAPLLIRTGFFEREGELLIHQLSNIPQMFKGQKIPVSGGVLQVDVNKHFIRSAELLWPEKMGLEVKNNGNSIEIQLPDFTLGQIISLKK